MTDSRSAPQPASATCMECGASPNARCVAPHFAANCPYAPRSEIAPQGETANDAPFRIARAWYPYNTEMCVVVQVALDQLEMALDTALQQCATQEHGK